MNADNKTEINDNKQAKQSNIIYYINIPKSNALWIPYLHAI